MLTLQIITITVAGLMVGNEFAVAAFIHPALNRLPEDASVSGASAVASILGRYMPFWYALTLLLTLCDAVVLHLLFGRWPVLIGVSALLWVVSILYSVTMLVPINNRVSSWTPGNRPSDWKSDRNRWDQLHRWRVLLLTISLVFLIWGILQTR